LINITSFERDSIEPPMNRNRALERRGFQLQKHTAPQIIDLTAANVLV